MNRQYSIYLVTLLFLIFQIFLMTESSKAASSGIDELVLAVQHFDPEHQLGIKYDSPEVAFMRQALQAARQQAPRLYRPEEHV